MEVTGQEILDLILKNAQEEAEHILKDAKKSAENTIEKQRQVARQSAEKRCRSLIKRAENDAEIIRGKVSTEIKRQAGWTVLSEKNHLIQNALDAVKNKLINLKKTEYVPVLENLIVEAGTVLGGGPLEVLLTDKDSNLPLNFSKMKKQITNNTGVKTQLKLSKEKSKDAGAIVKGQDGKIFEDNTFEAILKRRKKELTMKASKILFSEL